MPSTTARLRYLRVSPPKVRQVLALIHGQDVLTARDTLRLSERGVAREVGKLLDSAVGNAGHNDHVPEDELFVARAFADEGPTAKRWRPRARGRGVRIRKRTSHVTIVVERFDEPELARRRGSEASTGPGRGRRVRRSQAAAATGDHGGHDHDHADHGAEDAADGSEGAPSRGATRGARKGTRRSTATKAVKKPASKAAGGARATKKATTKKATTKKAATKKAVTKKAPKKPARPASRRSKAEEED